MYSLGKVISNVKEFYNEINGATLTGAIDVVVVEQQDGSFTCSPFHVRFGKLGVLRSKLKIVDLELNGESLNIHMKLGESGEAFFVEEIPADEMETSAHLATSPIPDNGFPLFQEAMLLPRRNSDEYSLDNYQNQVSDFSHRRYTDGQNSIKPSNTAQKREYQMLDNQFVYDFNPSSQISQDQEVFVMDDIRDPPAIHPIAPASPTVKMFRAEEVKEEESRAKDVVRKISINNDFRPISIEKEEPSIEPICEVKSIDVIPQQTVEETPKTQNNGTNKKKKKTKKSGSKKKNSLTRKLSNANYYSSQSEIVNPEVSETDKSNDTITSEQLEDEELLKNASFPVNNLIQDHFYSNPDVRTTEFDFKDIRRNNGSRPGTPVQSDSELEMARGSGVQGNNEPGQSWRWGELPSPPLTTKSSQSLTQPPATESLSSDDELSKSQIKDEMSINVASQTSGPSGPSGMFSFMKHFRGTTHPNAQSGAGGVYLAELEGGAIEPEVAALYFPSHTQSNTASMQHNVPRSLPMNISSNIDCLNHATEEDYESGNGPSLPQSPSSVDGLMSKGVDSDDDDIKIFSKGYVGLSLCGPQCLNQPSTALTEAFEQDAVRFEMLCTEPDLVHDPRLVVRIGDKYMPWVRGAPILLSLIVYHRPLPKNVFQNLIGGNEASANKSSDISQNAENKSQQPSGGFPWWYFRRSAEKQTRDESVIKSEVDAVDGKRVAADDSLPMEVKNKVTEIISDSIDLQEVETPLEAVTASTQTSFPSLTGIGGGYSGSQSSEDSDGSINGKDLPSVDTTTSQMKSQSSKQSDRFRKTLRLSSDEIARLNLREGMNEMVFSVTTAYQGTSRCKCHVFRWRYDDKIVISDIDGTITKSDVLGHIFPLMGKDWAQNGVAQLFTKIKNNGYKLLYLSARAIGQAKGTREYLRSIKQGNLSLPDGPLLLNPTSLLRAFHREVIEKKPEEFKIQCLSDIKALYPEGSKPFYAGYGNRSNDVCAYQTVGIPIVRIFTINHKGELKHELTQTFQSSYSNMSYIVDHLYPPVRGDVSEDFSQFAYWRQPIADLNEFSTAGVSPNLTVIPENASN